MRLERDQVFEAERRRFELRFCCEDCAHFDMGARACSHEWPSGPHRREANLGEALVGDLIFCKEFELC